jgi:hypothetical protein
MPTEYDDCEHLTGLFGGRCFLLFGGGCASDVSRDHLAMGLRSGGVGDAETAHVQPEEALLDNAADVGRVGGDGAPTARSRCVKS